MILRTIFLTLILVAATSRGSTFVIGGLFPLGLEDPNFRLLNGVYPRIAAELAVDDISAAGSLDAYNVSLELRATDSNCNGDTAVFSYLQFLQGLNSETQPNGLAAIPPYVILGPACNNAALSTASLTSKYSKDIQVSYAASTPLLSDPQQHPLFYRTVPSYTNYNRALYSLMREMNWWNIAVVHDDESHYTTAVEKLARYLDAKNQQNPSKEDSIANIVSVTGFNGLLDRKNPLMTSTRIFVAMVSEEHAATLMCSAFLLGMTTEHYQWIFLGDYFATWQWRTEVDTVTFHRTLKCSADDISEAMEAALFITHNQLVSDPEVRSSFNTRQAKFWGKYQSRVESELEGGFQSQFSFRGMATYDAVLAITLALKNVLKKSQGTDTVSQSFEVISQSNDYPSTGDMSRGTSGRRISQAVLDFNLAMERTRIRGLNSNIGFSSTSHSPQNSVAYILQVQSNEVIPIGQYLPRNDSINYYSRSITWKGFAFPRDRPIVKLRVASVYVVCVMVGFSILGIALSVLLLIVNWVYRKHKVIKASSPYMNFVIITGCIFGFLSVFFLSIENLDVNSRIPSFANYFLCNLRSFLLSTGFTLSFGALFAKTFRVYRVFRDPWTRKRAAKDGKLLAYIAGLLVYDILIITLWVSFHPLLLVRVNLNFNPAAFTEDRYCFCAPKTTSLSATTSYNFLLWIGLITIPKAVLLVFGIFLVTQTGNIKAVFFRDAKFTGFAIFSVMISCGVGVPTALFTMQFYQTNITFIASTSTILSCSFLILIMVFIPKLHLLRKYKNRVPSGVLLGLNPSFHIRRNISPYRMAFPPVHQTAVRSQQRVRTTKRQPIVRSAQVHDDDSSIEQSPQAYTEATIFSENPQPVQQFSLEAVYEAPPSNNAHVIIESLEDWWEPAFEDSPERERKYDVEEITVRIEGISGMISMIETRVRPRESGNTEQMTPSTSNIRRRESEHSIPHHVSIRLGLRNVQRSVCMPKNLSTIQEVHLEEDADDYDNHHHTPYYRFASFSGKSKPETPDSVTVNISKSKSCSFVQNKEHH